MRATGDADFLARGAIDIVVETARLWTTLGFWRRHGRRHASFHIHGVTGPDEYTTVVNDNLFTNVMARFNLRYAARERARRRGPVPRGVRADGGPGRLRRVGDRGVGARRRGDGDPVLARRSASTRRTPHFLDREVWDLENTPPDKLPLLLHFHPLVIYRFQVLKQADVVLALFLLAQRVHRRA